MIVDGNAVIVDSLIGGEMLRSVSVRMFSGTVCLVSSLRL